MTPTLNGRIQSRLVFVATIGSLVALVLGPLLPRPTPSASLADMYRTFFTALLLVAIVGVVWELIYHGVQQFRWEKDWPTLFGLITGVPEGLLVYQLLNRGVLWDVGEVPKTTFAIMFTLAWLSIWLVANGPLQILFLRWRYRGGRFL